MKKSIFVFCASLPLLAAFACRGKGPFLYTPNAPLWAGHDAAAPLFPVKAGVAPLQNLSVYGTPQTSKGRRFGTSNADEPAAGRAVNLTLGAFGRWPELSPETVRAALVAEIAADGLAARAEAADDDVSAISAGDRLLVSGDVAKAELDASRGGTKTLTLSLDLTIQARTAGAGAFDWIAAQGVYSDTETLAGATSQAPGGALGANESSAENAALNKIFAQALRGAAKALSDPDVRPKLGWTQP